MSLISGKGNLIINKNYSIVANIDSDISRYYLWHINRRFFSLTGKDTFDIGNKFELPKHGSHITLTNINLFEWNSQWNNLNIKEKKYQNIKFYFNPENLKIGGHTKHFKNWYIPVISPQLDSIKEELGITNNSLHLTICSNKNYIFNLNFKKRRENVCIK